MFFHWHRQRCICMPVVYMVYVHRRWMTHPKMCFICSRFCISETIWLQNPTNGFCFLMSAVSLEEKKKTNQLLCCIRSARGSCPMIHSFALYLPWFIFYFLETKAHMNHSPPFVAKWSSVYLSHIFPQHCSKQTVWSFSMEQNHKDLRTNCKKRNKNRCIVFAIPEITPDTKQQIAAIWLRQKKWTRNILFLSSVSIF